MAEIEVERLRECLSYNCRTGVLRWRVRLTSNVAVGTVAGCFNTRGYRVVRVDGQLFLAHRVAWAIYSGAWPECGLATLRGCQRDAIGIRGGNAGILKLMLTARLRTLVGLIRQRKLLLHLSGNTLRFMG